MIASPSPTRGLRKRRKALLLAALALPVLGWAALAFGGAPFLKGPIERRASAALGRTVSIDGDLRLLITPFSIYLDAGDVRVGNAEWGSAAHLLDVAQFGARFSTFDLLIGRDAPRAISLSGGTLNLERAPKGGKTNWAVARVPMLFDAGVLRQIDADDMIVRYRDPNVDVDARLALTKSGAGMVMLSGRGAVGDRPFVLHGALQSSDDAPAQFRVDARTGDVDLRVAGTADAPLLLSGSTLNVSAKGEDFAALAGLAGVDVPAMPGFALNARLGHIRKGWLFSRIEGQIGDTDIAGKLTLDRRSGRPRLVAQLASRNLDMGDGMALFGLQSGGGEDASEAPLALLPDARLSPDALGQFDAVVDYQAQQISGGLDGSSHLNMKLALIGGRLLVSPASVDLAGGYVSSDIMIDARSSPALARYDIRISPTPMGRLLASWGISPGGSTATAKGRIQLAGRGETVREALGNSDGRIALILPGGRVQTRSASGSPLDVAHLRDAMFGDGDAVEGAQPAGLNCGLIAFTVSGGVATADPILIDTDGHVLSGRGSFDFRGERLDLRLSADGKDSAWFSRPSTLLIGGTLADPIVMREPVSLFRPSRLLGLSMMLPDFGAIFGFVDPDDARAPACGPILRGAPAVAQRDRPRELASLR